MSTTIFNKNEADFDPDSMLEEPLKNEDLSTNSSFSEQSEIDIEAALLEADKTLSMIPSLPTRNEGKDTVTMKTIPMDLYFKGKFKTKIHIALMEFDAGIYSTSFCFFTERSNFSKLYELYLKACGTDVFYIRNPVFKTDKNHYIIKNMNMKNTEKSTVFVTIHTDKR